jgi:hypothetical protein
MKWKNNVSSPVLLFIDDLADSYVTPEQWNGKYLESDSGHYCNKPFSAISFFKNEILAKYPEIKVTFFVVAGKLQPDVTQSAGKRKSDTMNATEENRLFYSSLANHPNIELAYHGVFHTIPGKNSENNVAEWLTYNNLIEAKSTITVGKEYFKAATGSYPKGGKYPRYHSNEFSDESIDASGFMWWCRYYNRQSADGKRWRIFPNSFNNSFKNEFEPKRFGENNVVDIPTTLSGNLFNEEPNHDFKIKQYLIKNILKHPYDKIDFLLKNKLIISINEHISPIRLDGQRQQPNIFDDCEGLKKIFDYLRRKKVWYCTASELANWILDKR